MMHCCQHTESINGLRLNDKSLIDSALLPPPNYKSFARDLIDKIGGGSLATSYHTAHAGTVRRVPLCYA